MGIDYGRGLANIDTATGIRYGIFPRRMLDEWAESDATPVFRKCCPHCGSDLPEEWTPERYPHYLPSWELCPHCGEEIEEGDEHPDEPEFWGITQEESGKWSAWFDDSWDAWFTAGPWVYRANYASPCAPGAGYVSRLLTADRGDCYCYGPDPESLECSKECEQTSIEIAGQSFILVTRKRGGNES